MGHFHSSRPLNSPPTTFNFIKKMNLTTDQRLSLAQRIADEFQGFVKEELQYQVEDMKDNDELSYDYYTSQDDADNIMKLVIDLIAVPVQ